jgi:lipoprotein-releasing system permease protein
LNLPLTIATKYLLTRKSTNAIHIITGISIAGIAIGTAAILLVLSVFNGFEDLIVSLFSKFNPDVKITAAAGKHFQPTPQTLSAIRNLPGVAAASESLEEVAFFEYDDNQDFGILKGVDSSYQLASDILSSLQEGQFLLSAPQQDFAVLGAGMRNKLQVNIDDPFQLLRIFIAKRNAPGNLEQPYRKHLVRPAGTFRIQQDFDNQYVFVPLHVSRELLDLPDQVSAIEVKLSGRTDPRTTIRQLEILMGPGFLVKDRYQQDEAFLKLMNIEKWMSFAILALTLVLVAFNMIGALWMIVLEKKSDIAVLKSMGASDHLVRTVFLSLGLLLSLIGLILGFAIAISLFLIQKNFGIVSIPDGFVVNAYPISLRYPDLLAVSSVVLLIGLLASLPASSRTKSILASHAGS